MGRNDLKRSHQPQSPEIPVSTARSPRYPWVDVAKAFSILLVVLAHSRVEFGFTGIRSDFVDWLIQVFSTMRMPLFFAASGLFAAKWLSASWRILLNRKIALLLWVFVLWQPSVLIYKLIETAVLPNQPDNTVIEQVLKAVIAPVRPNGELWFLWALCVFFLVGRMISTVPRWLCVAVAALLSLLWMTFSPLLSDSFLRAAGDGWWGVPAYFFFFIGAALYREWLLQLFSNARWYTLVALFMPWVVLTWISVQCGSPESFRFFVCVAAVVGGFSLARALGWVSPLRRLGQRTLPVYVAHMPIVVGIVTLVFLTGWRPVSDEFDGPVIVAGAGIAVFVSLALYRFAVKSRWLRYLYEQPTWFRIRD